jgi:hypothetical protein
MAGTIVVDRIESDGSYASTINVASKVNFTGGMQIGGQDTTFAGMRNRIINGAMMIDQRNNGASLTMANATGKYVVDRFSSYVVSGSAANLSGQQVTDAPTGFVNSLKYTVGSAVTITTSDHFSPYQGIEANNISDLNWGTANAQPVTISFWVKSSVTGSFPINILNSGQTIGYGTLYTINQANTWTYVTKTIPGPTTGTWVTSGNNLGVLVFFSLGSGSSYLTTPNTWSSGTLYGTTGQTQLVTNAGATFQITGVQFEKGSVATPFEQRLYGQELALCQRYYFEFNSLDHVYSPFGVGMYRGSNIGDLVYQYPVEMRATPTITTSTLGSTNASTLWAVVGADITYISDITFVSNRKNGTGSFTTSGTGYTNRAMYGISGNTLNMKIRFSSEF